MARARNIKPGFYTNEDLAECSVWARYIFPGLWMMADREGRLEYRPKKIKGELLRFDEQAAEPLLEELQRWGFIEIYEVSGRKFIQILTFSKHQNPHHREAESELPPPPSLRLAPVANQSKPEADWGYQDTEAQGEPEESPGIDDEDVTCQGGPAVLIPDSGFSDSGSPSEALAVDQPDAPGEMPTPPVPNSRAAAISLLMRRSGVEGCNSANPIVQDWAANPAVTDDLLLTAADMAKARDVVRPGPKYLAPIVQQLLNPKPAKPKQDGWDRSEAGIQRKAREMGVQARGGESWDQLKARVWDAVDRAKRQGAAA
jgi:uncharacterized protein YlbG (UPF0298 family)